MRANFGFGALERSFDRNILPRALAGLLAHATFAAAVEHWPGAKITLRNGARIIDD